MNRRTALLLSLAVLGLLLYLWPALRAPVVLWSDSALDLDWARQGVGIVSPVPPTPGAEQPAHPAKPAYLLFLRAVQAVAPGGEETRFIVVVQSVLLWASIAATSLLVARRRGLGAGASLYLLLLFFLRLRDSASAVMPESLAAALVLPIAASLLDPPRKPGVSISLEFATALLDENARGPVELELLSFGSYGRFHYLLFPVIPPPCRSPAIREGSADLSPSTGIRSGSLDWWAHRGAP